MRKQTSSLKDVAEAAGVHRATASRALRNDPRISRETQERVREAAARLGYRPNPLVSMLMSHRRAVTTPRFQALIAYLTRFEEPGAWRKVSGSFGRIFQGAAEAADSQGYALEEFWLPPGPGNVSAVSRVLHARGIQALAIAPLPRPSGHLKLPWAKFSPVAIGYSLARPEVHRVATDHFGCLITAIRKIRKRGYRRIGVLLTGQVNERTDRRWLGAHLVEQERSQNDERIPALIASDWDDAVFARWFREHRPEVVVGVHMYRVMDALKNMGLRVPEEVGVVSLELREREQGMSGIDQNFEQIGAASIHALIGMLHRGERGIPAVAQKFLIDGTWVDGTTLGKPQ